MLKIDLQQYKLPGSYRRGGRECFLDPVRQRLIVQTPEEIVRQQVVEFLCEELKVPRHCIELEIPMSDFEKGAKGRADIVVFTVEEDYRYPVLVVECKAPNIQLIDDVFEQVAEYNEILGAVAIMTTNGVEARIWAQDEEQENYVPLQEFPFYDTLVQKNGFKYMEGELERWQRPAFEHQPGDALVSYARDVGWLADTTPPWQYSFVINLAGLLNDESQSLTPQVINGVRFLQDGGLRYTRFGNAGGNDIYGAYRYFVIEESADNTQIISLLMSGFDSHDDPQGSYKKGAAVMVVAIDDFENSRMSMMLNFNKHLQVIDGKVARIVHNTAMTVGKRGMVKKSEFRAFLQANYPQLLGQDGDVELGLLDLTTEMTWQRRDVQQFLANLVKYVIAREHFRKEKNQAVALMTAAEKAPAKARKEKDGISAKQSKASPPRPVDEVDEDDWAVESI